MTKKIISGKMSIADLEKLGFGCAYAGCANHYYGKMPKDWVCLIMWEGGPRTHASVAEVTLSPDCWRDACLCPEHAQEIDGLMCDIGRRLRKTRGAA